jgi:flagellar protein FliS
MQPIASSAALAKYRAVQVTTCSPGQLLVMLYDGLFRFLGEAEQAIVHKDRAVAGERISRSHAIVEQLLLGLNPQAAPELCANLEPLYGFCMRELIAANIAQDASKVAGVLRVLAPLREAWTIAVKQLADEKSAGR